jgi:hypothetical protein
MLSRIAALVVAFTVLSITTGSAADLDRIAAVIRKVAPVEVRIGRDGEPEIRSLDPAWPWRVIYIECKDDETCRSLTFMFELPAAVGSLEVANRLNITIRYSKAMVLPSGRPALQLDILLTIPFNEEVIRYFTLRWVGDVKRFTAAFRG